MTSLRRRRQTTTTAGNDSTASGTAGTSEAASPSKTPVIPTTRTASTWVALAVALVLLVLVLVFILQNLKAARVSFFTVHWKIPLGLDLLFAAVSGGLIALTTASLRILQLRRLVRRHAHHEEVTPAPPPELTN